MILHTEDIKLISEAIRDGAREHRIYTPEFYGQAMEALDEVKLALEAMECMMFNPEGVKPGDAPKCDHDWMQITIERPTPMPDLAPRHIYHKCSKCGATAK